MANSLLQFSEQNNVLFMLIFLVVYMLGNVLWRNNSVHVFYKKTKRFLADFGNYFIGLHPHKGRGRLSLVDPKLPLI